MARGVWYEDSRNRWRVRLYYNGHVIHRSYHKDEEEASETHRAAKAILDAMTPEEKDQLINPKISTDSLTDILSGLEATKRSKPTLV